jgi:hypothetical protein
LLPRLLAERDDELAHALEALQIELVWAADCAEFTDANLNAEQFLRAAGHVDLAARAALGVIGLVLDPPRRVRELAAGAGLLVADLLPMGGMGDVFAANVSASYRWDMHHEHPVTTAAELGPRELISYSVRVSSGRARCEAAVRESDEAFFVKHPVEDAFTLEWYAETPDWALPPIDHDLGGLTVRICAATEPQSLEFRPAVPALELARALGAPDAFARTVDVHMSSWRLATHAGDIQIGDWIVEASLSGSPTGEPVPGVDLPAAMAVTLGEGDVVRYVYLRRSE